MSHINLSSGVTIRSCGWGVDDQRTAPVVFLGFNFGGDMSADVCMTPDEARNLSEMLMGNAAAAEVPRKVAA